MIYSAMKLLASLAIGYVAVAIAMIVSQGTTDMPEREGLDFSNTMARDFEAPDSDDFRRATFAARDGTKLSFTHVKTNEAARLPLVIMLHGSGWHGGQFDALAWGLRDVAEVKALTLRGHGLTPKRRGDIDYIGQFEDDIADLIGETERKVVLLGHSSGGGLVVRFAGGEHRKMIDGAVLLAPFLKHDAPVTRPNSGGWTRVLLRRIIGLSMLNKLGIHALDHLMMIQFGLPQQVLESDQGGYATTAYSWRLNTSYAPRSDYLNDVALLPKFLLVVGREDEAFRAEGYEPLMTAATDKGQYKVVDGVRHLDIVDDARTAAFIREYLSEL
ncbi:lysophospholipase [Lentibacter algarum]|uniref:alpha/beta hydrolase n=1 Tax=Lentibacter algarum TaxID=576131 RepID=UPI001C0827F6|nr:alpha/beta fold hydrolase [Lentibacter algarum]MBU2982622.1 lysophospholipase [Lentibacter algarum]